MKLFRYLFMLLAISILFQGCSSFKYKSKEAFSNALEAARYEAITKVLEKNDIKADNKFIVMYIDYVMTKSARYSYLEKQFPIPDYKEFFNKAVPTLYYTYSLEKFKAAPEKWRKESMGFLVNGMPYPYAYLESKFRANLEKQLTEFRDDNAIFNFYSADEPEKYAKGYSDTKESYELMAVIFWHDVCCFKDFKCLSSQLQAEILAFDFRIKLFMKGMSMSDYGGVIDAIKTNWGNNSLRYMSAPPLCNLGDDTKVARVCTTIFDNSFRK